MPSQTTRLLDPPSRSRGRLQDPPSAEDHWDHETGSPGTLPPSWKRRHRHRSLRLPGQPGPVLLRTTPNSFPHKRIYGEENDLTIPVLPTVTTEDTQFRDVVIRSMGDFTPPSPVGQPAVPSPPVDHEFPWFAGGQSSACRSSVRSTGSRGVSACSTQLDLTRIWTTFSPSVSKCVT